jgi:serine/threonine protein phosphatase 1
MGNHEDLFLEALDVENSYSFGNWLHIGGEATLKSYGVSHPEDLPPEHIEFMKNLPSSRVTRTHVFVHAGLNFHLDNPLVATSQEFRLWEREFVVDAARIGGRKLVTGHTIQDLDTIRQSLGSDHIRLDNGCYYGRDYYGKGNLVALELNSGELYVQNNID